MSLNRVADETLHILEQGTYVPLSGREVSVRDAVARAVERTVLSACNARIALDVNAPATAVVFKDVALSSDGRLVDAASPAVAAAVTSLVRRAWLRDPTVDERDTLVRLAAEVQATGATTPGVAWMQAACLAVFSSAEAVFY